MINRNALFLGLGVFYVFIYLFIYYIVICSFIYLSCSLCSLSDCAEVMVPFNKWRLLKMSRESDRFRRNGPNCAVDRLNAETHVQTHSTEPEIRMRQFTVCTSPCVTTCTGRFSTDVCTLYYIQSFKKRGQAPPPCNVCHDQFSQ